MKIVKYLFIIGILQFSTTNNMGKKNGMEKHLQQHTYEGTIGTPWKPCSKGSGKQSHKLSLSRQKTHNSGKFQT